MTLFKLVLLLTVFFSATIVSSCKDDDKDSPSSGSSELVGTWYFVDDGAVVDYEDFFTFKSNGSGSYNYDNDPLNSDDFTYTYNAQTKVLTLNFKHWESETCRVEWLGRDAIDIDGYGTYIRK